MEFGLVALWLVLFLALLFAGIPLAAALFPRLADRGAGFALPISLVVLFLVAHVVGRLSLALAPWVGVAILAGLVVLVSTRDVSIDWGAGRELALVFTVSFLFLVAVRAFDPGIVPAGGEKFLDFGLLKSLLRAETIPPADVWFAGKPVMYYYGGHLVVSLLVRLTGTTPGVAYNLALAGFFGAFVAAAYGFAGSIAATDGRFDRRGALLGAFFVGVASNLLTPIRLLLVPLPDDLAESIARSIGVWQGRFGEGELITGIDNFSEWSATGVIDGAIHEFPLFAWYNGDLHAHMMAPPFTLLLAGVLYAYYLTPAADRRRRLALLAGVVPLLGALLAIVNTWSFAAVGGLTFLALLLSPTPPVSLLPSSLHRRVAPETRAGAEVSRVVGATVGAVGVTMLATLWSLPFWLSNASGRSLAFWPDSSSLSALLIVHGAFLLPFALYLGYLGWAVHGISRNRLTLLGVGMLAFLGVSSSLGYPVLGLVGPLLAGGYLLGRLAARRQSGTGLDGADVDPAPTDRPASDGGVLVDRLPGFEVVLLLAGAGLVLLAEFVYLEENAGFGRFNTVFKLYSQVWAFWAVAAAVALARLLQTAPSRPPTPRWSTVVRGFVGVLLVTTSIYGVLVVGGHFGGAIENGDTATLDGTVWIDRFHADEAPAIDWLDARPGQPRIVTRPGEAYRWSSAPASFTGLPTVIGWQHHERGFGRDPAAVAERADHVEAIYTGDRDTQRRLLDRYDVRYVYVGPLENDAYADITIDDHPAVSVVREWPDVTIYEVDRSALD